MKKILAAIVFCGLLLSTTWAGGMTAVAGITGGTGFHGIRMSVANDMYGELTLGPVVLNSSTYTVTGLLGMNMGQYTLGVGYTTGSSVSSVVDLVIRHEAALTKTLGIGIQGKILTMAGSTTTLFNGTSVYSTIAF